ncbi:hypothetical protein D3C76_1550680 [compost metagenome]
MPPRFVEHSVFAGEHDDRRVFEQFLISDQRGRLIAIQPRHQHVDEKDVGLERDSVGDAVKAIRAAQNVVTGILQHPTDRLADSVRVVHDHNSQRWLGFHFAFCPA